MQSEPRGAGRRKLAKSSRGRRKLDGTPERVNALSCAARGGTRLLGGSMPSEIELEILRRDAGAVAGDAVVIPLTRSDAPPRSLAPLDAALGGLLARVWAAGDFTGKSGESLSLPVSGIAAKRLVLIGLGD